LLVLILLFIGFNDFNIQRLGWKQCTIDNNDTTNLGEGNSPSDSILGQEEKRFHNKELVEEAIQFSKENPLSKRLILDCFQQRVLESPNKLLFAWLDDKAKIVKSFTRKKLWDKSFDLAYYLKTTHKLRPGQRAMIVYPPGIDFVVGLVALLQLGVIVVSVYPPKPDQLDTEIPKFAHFVEDSGATFALTTSWFKRVVQSSKIIHKTWPDSIQWVVTDKKLPTAPDGWNDHCYVPKPGDVALLQYTSGSTNDPKGVAITHRNMAMQCSYLERIHLVYAGIKDSSEFVSVSWTPAYHDMVCLICRIFIFSPVLMLKLIYIYD